MCGSLDTLPPQVDSAYVSGNVVAATSASQSARSWSIAGIVFGSVVVVLVVLVNGIIVPVVVATSKSNNDNYDY